jgi:DMSO/TMAO reductase YedYZ heme-binding membrane subunit
MSAGNSPALATRYTARFASLSFLLVYLARPIHDWWPIPLTRKWRSLRRVFGLAFASALTVHLAAVAALLAAGGAWPRPISLTFLSFTLLLAVAMVVTSTSRAQRRLGRAWHTLHRAGIHALWVAFAVGHVSPLSRGNLAAAPFFVLAVLAGGLRAFCWARRTKAATSARRDPIEPGAQLE